VRPGTISLQADGAAHGRTPLNLTVRRFSRAAMLRLLFLLALAVTVAAIVAPGSREILAWVLAFLSALLLGDLSMISHRLGSARARRP
jgi:hypothetical protein